MPSKAYEFDALPPFQSEIKGIDGTPEGVLRAPPGYTVVNRATGKHYIKETAATLNTGWKIVTTS